MDEYAGFAGSGIGREMGHYNWNQMWAFEVQGTMVLEDSGHRVILKSFNLSYFSTTVRIFYLLFFGVLGSSRDSAQTGFILLLGREVN